MYIHQWLINVILMNNKTSCLEYQSEYIQKIYHIGNALLYFAVVNKFLTLHMPLFLGTWNAI